MCHSVDQNRSLHAPSASQVAQSDARSTGRGFYLDWRKDGH